MSYSITCWATHGSLRRGANAPLLIWERRKTRYTHRRWVRAPKLSTTCVIMEPASTWLTVTSCSARFNACTRIANSKAQALGWQPWRGLYAVTAGESGGAAALAEGGRSFFLCPTHQFEGITPAQIEEQ